MGLFQNKTATDAKAEIAPGIERGLVARHLAIFFVGQPR
jgi:hypothetical protein